MPVFNIKATIEAIRTHIDASGYFISTQTGEPKQPVVGSKPHAAVYMESAHVVSLFAGGNTRELYVVNVRIYKDMLSEPQDQLEDTLHEAVSDMCADLMGEYDLGATINHIDVGGIYGSALSATWGYVDLGGKMFRVVDVKVPLVVDDSATANP